MSIVLSINMVNEFPFSINGMEPEIVSLLTNVFEPIANGWSSNAPFATNV